MKKKEPDSEKVELPNIRIEVSELLEILERISGGKYQVTGETSDTTFESIKDMKTHLAECARVNSIKIGPVDFDTGRRWGDTPTLSIHFCRWEFEDIVYTADEAQPLMNALKEELILYKSWLASPWVRKLFMGIPTIGIVWAGVTLLNYEPDPNRVLLFQLVSAAKALIVTIMTIMTMMLTLIWAYLERIVFKKVIGENTVFHQPRETWYHRNSSQIYVGAFTAVVGAVASHFLTK